MNEFIERLGWVLVHSLWQFAAVALLAGLTVLVFRRRTATLRYGLLVLAMAVSVAAPVATWFLVEIDESPELLSGRDSPIIEPASDQAVDPGFDASPFVDDPLAFDPVLDDSIPNPATTQFESAKLPIPMQLEQTQRPNVESAVSWLEQATMVLRPWLVWIVVAWGLGVVLCSARPLLGWRTLRRLRRVGSSAVPNEVLAAMQRVSERLGMRRSVRIFQSTLAQVPVVVGYLRPIILLPVSLVTSVPASQLEAILAHELAHVRRHDFVVNLLQTLVETVFFYHPGVWWLSRQIRVEREHCCDDIVVAVLDDRIEYGRALVAMEQLRGKNSVLALGAADGSLLSRVRRIIGLKSDRSGSSPWSVLALAVCSIAMICGMSVIGWLHAGQETNGAIEASVVGQPKPTRAEFAAREAKVEKHRAAGRVHPDYEPLSPTERIPLKPFFHEGTKAARKTFGTIKLTPKKKEGATVPAKGLEFLKPYPKLHGLSLDMTEKQFLAIVKKHGLKAKKEADGGSHHYLIPADADHDVIVMFGNNGDTCSGIQRIRGDNKQAGPQTLLKPTFLLPGHYNMMDVRFDKNDKELVSVSAYHFATVRRSDVLGRKLKSEITLASDKPFRPFRQATFRLSGDGRHVIAATDEYVGIWDSATGDLLKKLSYPTKEWKYDCIGKLDCTPDLSVIVGHLTTSYTGTASFYDAHLIVWDGKTGEVLNMVVDKHATPLHSIDLSTDGKRLATTNGGRAKVWETRTGKLIRSFPNDNKGRKHSDPEVSDQYTSQVWSVQLSPDGKQLAVGDILGVRLWDIESGKLQHQLDASYRYSSGNAALIYSKDGQLLARTGTSGKGKGKVVPIWSTATGKKLFELHTGSNCGAFSNDNKQFAVGFSDRQMALAVFQLSGVAADPPAQPASNANTPGGLRFHHRGKKAEELIAKWKPVWGDEQLGIKYGIAITSKQRQFHIGQRVPMTVFFRNVSDKPLQVDVRPGFFWDVPKVTAANGAAIEFERVALLGNVPHYREKLQPGEAFGAIYLSIGLGENPRPGRQDWAPYWNTPMVGPYKLKHTIDFKVGGPNANSDEKSLDWKPGKLTTGTLDFEIVAGPQPPARNQAAATLADPPARLDRDGVQSVPPPLEFRFVAQAADSKSEPRAPADFAKRDYSGNSVIGRTIAKDKGFIWVKVATTSHEISALPAERLRGGKVREVLLADTSEHALAWDGKWSVEECRVVPTRSVGPVEQFSIEMKLNEAGGKAMLALTKTHFDQRLAIVVNGQIVSAPIVRGKVSRHIVIIGNFNRAQADKLAASIRGPEAVNEGAAKIDPNGEIVGRLVDALTGKPVEGATIACGAVITNSKKRGGANAVTDAEGRYRMPVPAPGIYNVWLKKYDQDTSLTAAADDAILVEAGKVARSQLYLVVGRKVTGKVVDADGKTYANVGLSSYSPARPFSGGVQSVKTSKTGTFEFSLPPGRAYLYINPSVRVNPQGPRLSARAYINVSATEEFEPIKLTLKESNQEFGDPEWLNRSTPGTQIIRHEDNKDVTGTVVDESGKPVAGAKAFRHNGPIVTVNDQGEFRIEVRKGTQFVMHAFSPGYHIWTGTPTSGDVLKIVLEKKRLNVIGAGDGKRTEKGDAAQF
jgi:beta-lactamase regulating signal transducer with metallopeptidase domain/WD40 repeat protein